MGGGSADRSGELPSFLMETSVPFRQLIIELARFLDCEPIINNVLESRNALAKSIGYPSYIKKLYSDAALSLLLVDNSSKPLSTIDEFGRNLKVPLRKVYRLDPMIKTELENASSFDDLVSAYDKNMYDAVRTHNCVAFKSVIAYRVGLEVELVTEKEARDDFHVAKRKDSPMAWFGPVAKKLRDYLLLRAFSSSVELGAPMQIHTGLGDTDIVVAKCNPGLLLNALKDPKYQPTKVVMIHGGFPYTTEACWLANSLPNVYVELSAPVPTYFAPAISPERYKQMMQLAPVSKLIYGSDGGEFPEIHWLMIKMAKWSLSRALSSLVDDGAILGEDAQQYAELVLNGNARRLYRLQQSDLS